MGLPIMQKEILTAEEAAEYLRIGQTKLRELVKNGEIITLDYTDKLLFDYSDLRAFVEKSKKIIPIKKEK